jgi:D-alanyl-D-alanine carboxypeptidase/D-alanyl-D-alanine-endopeptidase (penicillin-binding protein 4)
MPPAGFGGCDARLLIRRPPGSKTLDISGDIPPRAAPCTEHIAIDDPAQFSALALKSALERRGVRITGAATAQHWDPGRLPGTPEDRNRDDGSVGFFLSHPGAIETCVAQSIAGPAPPKQTVLATHTAAPLITDLTYTNKVSQNLHAEILLRNLGVKIDLCGGGDVPHSLNAVRQWLMHIGLSPHEFVFYDGSGLSLHDLVTPHAVAQLLAYAASDPKTGQPQPWFAVWKSSLPIGGVDGTLDDRFTQPPLKGHVFAKTGTHSEDRALSGYLDAASGRTVIFSILVGNHLPSTTADRDAMDRIVAAIQSAE